jgi:putative acetyltransferase
MWGETGVSEIAIRAETPGDRDGVREVLRAAFRGETEAKLVDELHAADDIVLSLAATTAEGRVIGYVAFTRLLVAQADCIGLAPVAVTPPYQKRGIGKALIEQGISMLRQRGEKLIFVLGDPAYYTRFGFDLTAAAAFTSSYAGPYFMARPLSADAPTSGPVQYPPAFARLG